MLATIATHTVDLGALTPNALVLDAGCREFDFADAMRSRGCRVVCLDSDPDVWGGDLNAVGRLALVGEGQPSEAQHVQAGVGSRVRFIDGGIRVPTTTIAALHQKHGFFDVIKLDIEGCEYDVLLTWPGPIAGQVSVEFHEPLGLGKAVHGDDVYDRIVAHMGQWYELVKHDLTPYDGGENYYDSLWVLRR